MAEVELSVVIPAYDEALVIQPTIKAVAAYLTAARIAHEILIVDDGSADGTVQAVRELIPAIPTVRVLPAEHRGKGHAVCMGMLDARGTQILFMDADHSTRIEEWAKYAPWLRDGYEVVIGSRKIPGANIQVRQPWLRETMGKGFTWLTNALLQAGVSDVTCGFKGFRSDAARAIFRLQRLDGWGFDAEILYIARRIGCRIKEVPVIWADDASTNVRLGRDALRSFQELLAVRYGAWRGWYTKDGSRAS